MTKLDSILKSRHYFANKGPSSQGYGFSCGHVWMWELDCEESWAPKNWYFWTVVLEKTLESPLDCKEIQPVHPKGSQSWTFIGRTDAEAENSILWPPDTKNRWLIGKDPDSGKDWRQEEKGMTEDEMVGWYHWRDGHEFVKAPEVGDGQRVRHDWATEPNWTETVKTVVDVLTEVMEGQFLEALICHYKQLGFLYVEVWTTTEFWTEDWRGLTYTLKESLLTVFQNRMQRHKDKSRKIS